ncbi:MAG: MerR family transcriptional regulator [Candidatus Cloacimonetes bacterium]|nr:MerR family transcriptional regulator [Candidatus Cloacimonadota bacterium]MCF7813831.1 MerR family transcriptional regulator [Candidatus Cloacimonadota bacterium]MCF7868269.1 MerR family transcriptional regulator [Candidatus Cloacimonadota bacterium]MCF7883757.1 MerR family transcriptional regulator [Candidatus Cloacimonadota bacterium]
MEKKDRYLIGEVAKQLGIHDQTIRMYERKKLISPQRSEHQTRLFSKNDVTKINIIITLTQEIGLNLSGVKIVFSLARKLKMSDDELLDFIYDHKNEFHV